MTASKNNLVLGLIAISTMLLGLSVLLMGHHKQLLLTTDFYHLTKLFSGNAFSYLAGAIFILCALLSIICIKKPELNKALAVLLIMMSSVPLLSLFSASMWIESLGGFPAIGSGQGVIKYFALLSIGILFASNKLTNKSQQWLAILPVVIVLLWIGGMKFTALEAKGIEDLVQSSPLMSWMYLLWDVQTTSNIIGVYDIMALLLLIAAIYKPKLLWPALLMSGAVFVVTQTFLISWSGALSAETLLSTGGHFLIKDLWFIANLIMFYQLNQQGKADNS